MFKFLVPAIALALAPVISLAGVTINDDMLQTDFDVAGVTLGMQPAVAFSELESRGYKMDEEDGYGTARGPSFDDLVKMQTGEISEGGAKSSWKMATFRKGDEGVHLKFKPLPTGNGASVIVYASMQAGMDFERFLPLVTEEYGRPKFVSHNKARWSDMPLKSEEFDRDAGAIWLEARNGRSIFDNDRFQQVKASITLTDGRISLVDPEEEAKIWVPVPKSTF